MRVHTCDSLCACVYVCVIACGCLVWPRLLEVCCITDTCLYVWLVCKLRKLRVCVFVEQAIGGFMRVVYVF